MVTIPDAKAKELFDIRWCNSEEDSSPYQPYPHYRRYSCRTYNTSGIQLFLAMETVEKPHWQMLCFLQPEP
jgi:hypothetical protein